MQVSEETVDKIVLEHRAAGQTQGNAMLQVGQDDVTIAKDLVVNGNFIVHGNTTTLNTSTLNIEDNIISLNKNTVGSPSLDSGFDFNRRPASSKDISENFTTLLSSLYVFAKNAVLDSSISNSKELSMEENLPNQAENGFTFFAENSIFLIAMCLMFLYTYNIRIVE